MFRESSRPQPKEFAVSIKDIDKIIATKIYMNTDAIGKEFEESYTKPTGKEEEIILDLKNPDENAYKFFLNHKMLEMEWDDPTMNKKYSNYIEKEQQAELDRYLK